LEQLNHTATSYSRAIRPGLSHEGEVYDAAWDKNSGTLSL
jgi:hypothetical protein